jgi:hypothetical protein
MFGVMSKVLDETPWPETPPTMVPTVFLYDRTDNGRRMLANATEIKSQLERDYDVNVDYRGKDWKDVLSNSTLQAQIYNSHSNILAPHGAHLTNLFYSRPATKVFEIQCYMNPSHFRAIHQQWFSGWAPVIGLKYQIYTEVEGCKLADGTLPKNYSPEWVRVNVTQIVEKAADFFGLKRRVI